MVEGIIFDIKHFAVHDGPGIRQTVFFKGCPLHCWWCHNPESQSFSIDSYTKETRLDELIFSRPEMLGYKISVDELMQQIEGDRVFFEESGGGVTFSGGEPCSQPEFLVQMLIKCRNAGIHTAVDTSGYTKQTDFERIANHTDLFLYDLKLADDNLHRKYTGVGNSQIVSNLYWLDAANIPYVIRIPVVPDITDTRENLDGLMQILKGLHHCGAVELLPYHNISQHKYDRFGISNRLHNIPTMSAHELKPLVEKFGSQGFNIVINA